MFVISWVPFRKRHYPLEAFRMPMKRNFLDKTFGYSHLYSSVWSFKPKEPMRISMKRLAQMIFFFAIPKKQQRRSHYHLRGCDWSQKWKFLAQSKMGLFEDIKWITAYIFNNFYITALREIYIAIQEGRQKYCRSLQLFWGTYLPHNTRINQDYLWGSKFLTAI